MFGTAKAFIFSNPWMILAVVAALAASHGYAYISGKSGERNTQAAEKLVAVQRAIEQSQLIAKQDADIAAANIQTVERIRTVTRTIRAKESRHANANPLPVDCMLDAERMRNINDALANNVTADTAKPVYRLPGAASIGNK